MVAGENDDDALIAMLAMAKESLAHARPISGVALRLESDGWMPWLPDTAHPMHWDFRMLRLDSRGRDYAEQKELLDELNEKNSGGVVVATYNVVKDDTGHVNSYAVLSPGVDTLLPETDLIIFMREGHPALMVEFVLVEARGSHLMTAMDIYPPRYRIRESPTDSELTEIAGRPI